MHDQVLLIIVLGVVAIAATVQAVALVSALLAVRRLESRFDEAERALRPRIDRLGRVIDNVADWTDGAAEHVPRVVADIQGSLDVVRGIGRLGGRVFGKALLPLATGVALWKGLKAGARAYRHLRPGTPAAPDALMAATATRRE